MNPGAPFVVGYARGVIYATGKGPESVHESAYIFAPNLEDYRCPNVFAVYSALSGKYYDSALKLNTNSFYSSFTSQYIMRFNGHTKYIKTGDIYIYYIYIVTEHMFLRH